MASNRVLMDGDFAKGVYINRPRFSYPFLKNGDKASFVIERDFLKSAATWIPGETGKERYPGIGDCVLILESPPVPTGKGDVLQMVRTFARVPTVQTEYSSQPINKPAPSVLGTSAGTIYDLTGTDSDSTNGSTYGFDMGAAYTYASALFGNDEVYSQLATVSSVTTPTGGTFTLTYNGSTTAALAYNETTANIATALNGLASSVADGITWGCTTRLTDADRRVTVAASVGTPVGKVTGNFASLTPAACTTAFTAKPSAAAGANHIVGIARRCSYTSHGLSASGTLVCNHGQSTDNKILLPYTTHWLVVDANTIAVDQFFSFATASLTVGKKIRNYTPGASRIRIKRTSTFYLPGVTSGITTAEDIPIPSAATSDAALLTLVAAAATGFQSYDAEPLRQYRDSPIYEQATASIDMADL